MGQRQRAAIVAFPKPKNPELFPTSEAYPVAAMVGNLQVFPAAAAGMPAWARQRGQITDVSRIGLAGLY